MSAQTEHPILFNAPMVRAVLAGTKTQTRRVVKHGEFNMPEQLESAESDLLAHALTSGAVRCPYGQPGDRLWVREAHYLHGIWSVRKDDDGKRRWTFHPNPDMGVQFTEPNGLIKGRSTTVAGWYRRPSIHMPRWASRITLEVTGVRVERLQDISEADAAAEGLTFSAKARRSDGCMGIYELRMPDGKLHFNDNACDLFRTLWESINGPGSWDANPWVWVVEFKRLEAA